MEQKSTDELNDLLERTKPAQLDAYLKDNAEYLTKGKKSFYYYFKDVLDEKNVRLDDVYSFAGVSESYGGAIVRQERHTKNRDLIIRLCIAGRFSWDETSRALKLYGMSELYSRDPRDACIIVALNNRVYDLGDIDEILLRHRFKKLTKST